MEEQQAGMIRIVRLPEILKMNLRLKAAPQPTQEDIPGRIHSSLGNWFIQLIFVTS